MAIQPLREVVDRRALGAIRFVDATTGLPLNIPLRISGEGVRHIRNLSGLTVLLEAPGMRTYTESFDAPPASPAVGSKQVALSIVDPAGRYLPRSVTVSLPRDPEAAQVVGPASLFRAVDVPLYPSPTAQAGANWASIRVSLRAKTSNAPVSGAWLRITRNNDKALLAQGMTDRNGEALVMAAGLPVTTWDGGRGAVLVSEFPATLEAFIDLETLKTLIAQKSDSDFFGISTVPANPDDLEARRVALVAALTANDQAAADRAKLATVKSDALKLASGRELIVQLNMTL